MQELDDIGAGARRVGEHQVGSVHRAGHDPAQVLAQHRVRILGHTQKREIVHSEDLAAGQHTLAIDVLGNMKNMMGSHHIEALPLRWTYEYAPQPMPPGKSYKLTPTGLLTDPELLCPLR